MNAREITDAILLLFLIAAVLTPPIIMLQILWDLTFPLRRRYHRHRLIVRARRAGLYARERHAISMQLPPEAGMRQRPMTTDRIGAGR
jgi:hypothetical protein